MRDFYFVGQVLGAAKIVVVAVIGAVLGTVATEALTSPDIPPDIRGTALVIIWPLVVICVTIVAVAWLLRDRSTAEDARRADRYRQALDEQLLVDYRTDPKHKLSIGAKVQEHMRNADRREQYKKLGIEDLFIWDPRRED